LRASLLESQAEVRLSQTMTGSGWVLSSSSHSRLSSRTCQVRSWGVGEASFHADQQHQQPDHKGVEQSNGFEDFVQPPSEHRHVTNVPAKMYARNMSSPVPESKPAWLLVAIVTGADAALRVRVWRELRKLGAVYLHSSVCLLPDRLNVADTVETLSRRVRDNGGKARVLKTVLVDDAEEARIIAEQSADRDTEYREVVERTGDFLAEIDRETQRNRATYTEVEESEADLERFDRWLASIVARDYFDAAGRHQAEQAIQRCREALAAFEAAAVAADTDTNSDASPQQRGADQPESPAMGGD
jgi:hypothetical protein